MQNSAKSFLDASVGQYSTAVTEHAEMNLVNSHVSYAFLPVWILATKWNNKNYLFVMNAQTGKMIGDDLPIDKKKLLLTYLVTTAILFAIFYLVMVIM